MKNKLFLLQLFTSGEKKTHIKDPQEEQRQKCFKTKYTQQIHIKPKRCIIYIQFYTTQQLD